MARKRTKVDLNKLNYRDKKAIEITAKFGFITFDEMRKIGISEKRINNFANDSNKIFEFEEKRLNGIVQKCYTLDKKGKEYAKKELEIKQIYRSNSTKHDNWQKEYMLKKTDEEISSYMNEKQLSALYSDEIKSFKSQGIEISTPDGAYINSLGELVVVETVTKNYTSQMIEAKENFAKYILGGAEIEFNYRR